MHRRPRRWRWDIDRDGLAWLVERLVTFKRDNLASIRALRETMASRESIALIRDVMERTAALFAPFTAGPLETQVLMAASTTPSTTGPNS